MKNYDTNSTKSLISRLPNVSLFIVCIVFLFLGLHAAYVTSPGRTFDLRHLNSRRIPLNLLNSRQSSSSASGDIGGVKDGLPAHWPELFIFRRSKKTGSSSMMNAFMDILEPFGYHSLPQMPNELEDVIRNEYKKPNPRRMMVLHHNKVTKNQHPNINKVIIVDTIRDGFKQITGYCRYMKGVKTCNGQDMIDCLRANTSQSQNRYRWAGDEIEDKNTYIDLPLASDMPALSTTVLRTVFNHPNITLNLQGFNIRGTHCNEKKDMVAKEIYDELYDELETQVFKLRKRMLVIAGYPYIADSSLRGKIDIKDMMKAANEMENEKYQIGKVQRAPNGKSDQVKDLLRLLQAWKRDENGNLVIVQRRRDV